MLLPDAAALDAAVGYEGDGPVPDEVLSNDDPAPGIPVTPTPAMGGVLARTLTRGVGVDGRRDASGSDPRWRSGHKPLVAASA
jgi:hypothetical protein